MQFTIGKYIITGKQVLLFLVIIAIGLFIVNQFLEMQQKATDIVDPCSRCVKQFPRVKSCFEIQEVLPSLNFSIPG
jgi:hypothetical protein